VHQKKLVPPIIPYVMHPGDPANFEEYDPEEEIKPHEILIEADVQVCQRFVFSFKSSLGSIWRLQILL
jgi:hypothetical protein